MRFLYKIGVVFVVVAIVCMSQSAYGETTIGRWCDRMVPNMPKFNRIMSIVVKNDGRVFLRSFFKDGSSSVRELQEIGGSIYKIINSPTGDKYRIIPSTGNIQVLDNDGLIGIATRLENAPKYGECS